MATSNDLLNKLAAHPRHLTTPQLNGCPALSPHAAWPGWGARPPGALPLFAEESTPSPPGLPQGRRPGDGGSPVDGVCQSAATVTAGGGGSRFQRSNGRMAQDARGGGGRGRGPGLRPGRRLFEPRGRCLLLRPLSKCWRANPAQYCVWRELVSDG